MDMQLHAAAKGAFDRLQLPPRLTLELLIPHLEKLRSRRIVVIESEKLSGTKICGLWIPRPQADVVYHSPARGVLHRQQMILHELAHMILRHDEDEAAAWQGIGIFRDLSGEVVAKALARGDFRSEAEIAAEYLADLLAAALREPTREILGYEDFFE